jgi:hypothetical protein
MRGGNCPFNRDVGGASDGSEGRAEKDGVVVNANTNGFITKGGDGGEDVGPCGRSVKFDLREDCDDSGCRITDCTENVAMTKRVRSGGRAPDVQRTGVKRIRRVPITGRTTVDFSDTGLGSSTVRANGQR